MGIWWDSTLYSLAQINDVSEEHASFIFMVARFDFTAMKKRAMLTQYHIEDYSDVYVYCTSMCHFYLGRTYFALVHICGLNYFG